MHRIALILPLSLAVCLFLSPLALAAGPDIAWPTFRGSARTGVSTETGLLQSWPAGGPPLVWDVAGAGRGYASLAIAEGRIYTLGDAPSTAEDKDEYLLCFDQASGKPLWKTRLGSAWTSGQPNWQSSRSTPTVSGKMVYVLTAHGELICCDSTTGSESWRKDLKKDFSGKKADGWGYSESVLIDGERLVCTPGGETNTMVALNKDNGEMVWKTSRPGDRGAGHASIVIAEVGGKRIYVQTTGSGALGVSADDGKLLWSYEIERTTAVIPTAIVRDNLVFFSAGYKRGGALLKQVAGGEAGIAVEEVYPLNIKLANKHGGIVLVGDYLYGDSDDAGTPFCADLLTGENKWTNRGPGRGSASFTAADGCLYIRFSDGLMVLAKADPEKFVELGSFKIPDSGERPSWSHSVIVGGKLYMREQDRILCYDIQVK